MKVNAWYQKRGIRFILERAQRLNERYGLTSKKATDRIEHCVEALQGLGCLPTFFVPGMVVQRHLPFILRLQDIGTEIAVHGFNHVDLKVYPPEDAGQQLKRAVELFQASGLQAHGFRCPYLSVSDGLINALPRGLFEYSSNRAIQWPLQKPEENEQKLLYKTIEGFYLPKEAETHLCIPWQENGMVEIPVCVPDDLQLHDGLGYGLEQISGNWINILSQTYQRAEVFNLMFHPELASFCEDPFIEVLREAITFRPKIWLARLQDISAWWLEKMTFKTDILPEVDGFTIRFHCTPRATIVSRGFEPQAPAIPWHANYSRLDTRILPVVGNILPLVGVAPATPAWVTSFLQRMGYISVEGELAQRCSVYLDSACLDHFDDPVALMDYIEDCAAPLVRYWPWPDGMRSALCLTGDLDALSLIDYATRLFIK